MELEAKLDGVERKEKLIQRKDEATGQKVDDKEVFYTAKFAMKKIKLEKDSGNVKEGTSDPWLRITISSYDEKVFESFKDAKMGDPVLISVDLV